MRPAPSQGDLQAMLAEALEQYAAHPGDYLEGVVAGLLRALEREPDRGWCRDTQQDENARDRPPAQRVRDYINGTKAVMAWAQGTAASPPVPVVLTAPHSSEPAGSPDGGQ